MNDSEFEPTFHQNHERREGRHECYVGPLSKWQRFGTELSTIPPRRSFQTDHKTRQKGKWTLLRISVPERSNWAGTSTIADERAKMRWRDYWL